jgi:hypothetical protein
VRLTGARKRDVALSSMLKPFRNTASTFDISVDVRWVEALRSDAGSTVFESGGAWRLKEAHQSLLFHFTAPLVSDHPYRELVIDRRFKAAAVEISWKPFSTWADQPDPLAYPLDELLIMHRLTQERAIELHGSGIVRNNGVANLFVGHSGAGKSTTTRLWTSREEVEVLSDDRIIVRYDDGRDGPAGPTGMRMYGTPWHGEAMFASPNSAPLTRIFILEHGHGNVITRLTRSQAVGELFARAFVPFHRHEYIENALSFLEQLVSSVPCYRYFFEPDERAVERVLHFND